jgi:hypothetical protein
MSVIATVDERRGGEVAVLRSSSICIAHACKQSLRQRSAGWVHGGGCGGSGGERNCEREAGNSSTLQLLRIASERSVHIQRSFEKRAPQLELFRQSADVHRRPPSVQNMLSQRARASC